MTDNAKLLEIVERLRRVSATLDNIAAMASDLANSAPPDWAFPVGGAEYPVNLWYAASFHTWSKRNPDGHTGLDLNVQVGGRGGIDEGQPVYAIADGVVEQVGNSAGWLGVVILHIEDVGGVPLYVRYAHLNAKTIPVSAGQYVIAGSTLGYLGDYRNAAGHKAAHLHLDAALNHFAWNVYRAPEIAWVDPLPILKAHLDPALVDLMVSEA